jgi:2-oxoglutarate dehydrogenase E1 component
LDPQDEVPSDSLAISHLIRSYQVNGHLGAKLDPLGIHNPESFPFRPPPVDKDGYPAELGLDFHGFTDADLDRKLYFKGRSAGGNKGYLEELASAPGKVTLRAILEQLRKTYCGTLGVEYMHISEPNKVNWLRQRMEHPRWQSYDKEKKAHIFERLCFADTFENFLANKFNTTKRFGLDGGEAIVPGLKCAIDRATELGAHSFVLGMPHRGRLNILANVMRKPMPLIFSEFQGTHFDIDDFTKGHTKYGISGDVKYHLGSSMDRTYPDGRRIHLSLVANPSHLECVNPVVVGKVRAKQYYCGNRYVLTGCYFSSGLRLVVYHPRHACCGGSLFFRCLTILRFGTTATRTSAMWYLSSFTEMQRLQDKVSCTKQCSLRMSRILMSEGPFTSL